MLGLCCLLSVVVPFFSFHHHLMFCRDAFHVHSSLRVTTLSSVSDRRQWLQSDATSLFNDAQQIADAIDRGLCCNRHQHGQLLLEDNAIGGGGGQCAANLPSPPSPICIGLVAPKSALLVSMVIAVLNTGNAFAIFEPGPPNYLERRFARFRIKLALFDASSSSLTPLDEAAFCNTQFLHISERLTIGHFAKEEDTVVPPPNGTANAGAIDFKEICYAIQTSGSTGVPKVVLVPFSAILPNIEDFIERFSLNASSTVLYATQTNFDPSMVELLVALRVGCELAIPPPNWVGGRAIAATLFSNDFRLSFVQLTPAVLQCLAGDILRHIFGPNSPIQTLLIGGDNFPLNLVKNYMSPACPMAVYNVYGLTEVSCWASVHRFRISNLSKFPHNLLPIGHPLMGTRFGISSNGTLLVYGRNCIINFKQYPNADHDADDGLSLPPPTPTGDIAFSMQCPPQPGDDQQQQDSGGQMCLFVRGRHKPNSMLPNGGETENELMASFPAIVFAKMVYVDNCRFLFADHLDGVSTMVEQKIRAKIAKPQWPTRTFWNVHKNGRLTENGKISEHFLRQFVFSAYGKHRRQISLQKFLENRFGIVAMEDTLRMPLRHLGIGSLEAAEIAFLLHNNAQEQQDSACSIEDDTTTARHTLRFLLDERNTLGEFLTEFSTTTIMPPTTTITTTDSIIMGVAKNDGHVEDDSKDDDHCVVVTHKQSPAAESAKDDTTVVVGVEDNNNGDGGYHRHHHDQPQQQQQQQQQIVAASSLSPPIKFRIDQLWAVNLGKCIDGTPVHHDGVVYAASHSGTMKGVRLATGVPVISLHYPDDRFEAGCAVCGTNMLAFGGFAGIMRLFDLSSSSYDQQQGIVIRPIISVDCGAEIRMAPVFGYDYGDDARGIRLFWGTYNERIWKLDIVVDADAQQQQQTKKGIVAHFDVTGHGPLRTQPLLIHQLIVFGTLGSTVFAVQCKEFDSIVWHHQMDSPIFAAPIAFVGCCLALSVRGQIQLIRPEDGQLVTSVFSLSNYGQHHFFDSPTPIGNCATDVGDEQQQQQQRHNHQHLLICAAGVGAASSSLLLLSYHHRSSASSSSSSSSSSANANCCFSVLRRFVLPCQQQDGGTVESLVRRPVLYGRCRRFAFLLTNKGTLFRISLDVLHSLRPPPVDHPQSPSSSANNNNNNNNNNDNTYNASDNDDDDDDPCVVLSMGLDCVVVFSMAQQQQQQQQVETFGHPLLLPLQNHCRRRQLPPPSPHPSPKQSTTKEHVEEQIWRDDNGDPGDDDRDDPPFIVVFGARDDLLRARLCVPQQHL